MNILESLAGILGEGGKAGARTAGARGVPASTAGHSGLGAGLGGMLNSGALGDIARNVLTNRKGDFSWLKGALMAGAGSMLWNKLTERVGQANAAVPQYGKVQATPDQKAERLIRSLVYAARADGHIDSKEKAAIGQQLQTLNLGRQGQELVEKAMNEPLDPSIIAQGVRDPEEALQIYTLSRAAVDPDNFMEKAYLDGLAQALRIPEDVRDQIEDQVMVRR
ncbi:MAG: DUF533 domain-containing protein [Planctomycetes bacterium]|nr:DUF533 domain-containing protein [Planctomycetota bacterium]